MYQNPQNLQEFVVDNVIKQEDPELIKLKEKLAKKKEKRMVLLDKKEEWVKEMNYEFECNHKNVYPPLIDEYPEKCKNCGTREYFIKSYTDDIDIVCGKCNHTAGVLPGYGYDIKCKKLTQEQLKTIIDKRAKWYYDQIEGEKPEFEKLPKSCTSCGDNTFLKMAFVDQNDNPDTKGVLFCGECAEPITIN